MNARELLQEAHDLIRDALHAKSQPRLDQAMIKVNRTFGAELATGIAEQEIAKLPEDLFEWWMGPCELCRQMVPGHTHN